MWFLRKRVEEKRWWELVRTRRKKLAKQNCWLIIDVWKSRHCFVEELTFWNEELERAG